MDESEINASTFLNILSRSNEITSDFWRIQELTSCSKISLSNSSFFCISSVSCSFRSDAERSMRAFIKNLWPVDPWVPIICPSCRQSSESRETLMSLDSFKLLHEVLMEVKGSQCSPKRLSHRFPLFHSSIVKPVSDSFSSLKKKYYIFKKNFSDHFFELFRIVVDNLLKRLTNKYLQTELLLPIWLHSYNRTRRWLYSSDFQYNISVKIVVNSSIY